VDEATRDEASERRRARGSRDENDRQGFDLVRSLETSRRRVVTTRWLCAPSRLPPRASLREDGVRARRERGGMGDRRVDAVTVDRLREFVRRDGASGGRARRARGANAMDGRAGSRARVESDARRVQTRETATREARSGD
jgi:hypothetical protein